MRSLKFFLLALAFATGANAADDEEAPQPEQVEILRQQLETQRQKLEALQQQLEEQRHMLNELDHRIETIKSGRASEDDRMPVGGNAAPDSRGVSKDASATVSPTSVAALRESWRLVVRGMPAQEVRATLGPATREMLINGRRVWYYIYPGIGRASVFFNSESRVTSSQAPVSGW